jgi:hypothetical protein
LVNEPSGKGRDSACERCTGPWLCVGLGDNNLDLVQVGTQSTGGGSRDGWLDRLASNWEILWAYPGPCIKALERKGFMLLLLGHINTAKVESLEVIRGERGMPPEVPQAHAKPCRFFMEGSREKTVQNSAR